jgi:16S rRNA (cytidine1402-2'-O)-methyltransferase
MAGTLYVVATPIGNLEDLSARALRMLQTVSLIAAEDTRVTRKLLSRYEVHTPVTSYHAHTGPGKIQSLVERLQAGEDLALVSDAGTPAISDPGVSLVAAAVAAGVKVVPIPGPSAAVAALSASGLEAPGFLFHGFLPRNRAGRRKALEPLKSLPHALVFYEAPGRAADTLAALRETLGDRPAVAAREITKKFEEFIRGPLSEIEAQLRAKVPRGEFVIVVGGATEPEPGVSDDTARARLAGLLRSGASVKDAARATAAELGRSRNEMYSLAQEISETRKAGAEPNQVN